MKKTMFYVLTAIMVVAVIAAFSGCTQAPTATSAPAATTAAPTVAPTDAPKKLTYGYIAYDMKDVWNQYGAEAFQYAAKQKGVDVILLDSENNAEKSVQCMQQLIQKKVDGISIFPISPDQASQLIKMANEANIPITVENLKEGITGNFISIVACQYNDIGYAAIKYISEKWPGAKVLFVAGAEGGGVWETYMIGVNKALEEFKDKVSIPEGYIIHGDWATEKAQNVTTSFLATGKKFDVVFANNDLMAIGVSNALKEKGLTNIPIISTGGSPDGLKMVADGTEYANMTAPVSLQGLITFRNLWWNTNGKKPEAFYPLPIIPIDKDNLDKAIKWDAVDQATIDYIGGLD